MKFSVFALLSLLVLTACGGGGPAANRFVLSSDEVTFSGVPHARHARAGTLKIVLPAASPGLDSVQIAVMQKNGEMSFISGREWAEPLPKLVQAQLVEAAEQAGLYANVVPDSQGVASHYSLMTDIREFALYQKEGAPEVHVRLVGRVVNPVTRTVLASVSATAHAPAGGEGGVMAAFDTASSEAVKDVVQKIAKKLR